MKSTLRSSLFAAAALAATVGFDISAARAQVTCGSTINIKAVMAVDLVCGVEDPGFTVGAGGSVDMAGHSLTTCAGCDGVLLSGQGAKLSNGLILSGGATSRGVVLAGGTHKVENIAVQGADISFDSTSDKNKIKNCTADGAVIGFQVNGQKNAISRSHSGGSEDYNFNIVGDNNNLTENTSSNLDIGAGGAGFFVDGNANKLSRNNSTDDRGVFGAFVVSGNDNKLSSNSVTGSSSTGLTIIGNENKISKTTANDSVNAGILISGDNNKLSKNAANDNGNEGITIAGNFNNINASNTSNNGNSGIHLFAGSATNSLKSNVTMRNGDNGVLLDMGAVTNAISKTVALGNTDPDLQDDNANCGGNVWAKSVFGSSEADGVPAHACIQ